MNICMLDYPYFDGTVSAWPDVKEKYQELLESHGLDKLVNIKDEDPHGLRIDVKERYDESNQLFYSIPNNVCANRLAKYKIKNFNDQRDGSLACQTLKEYYDQDCEKIVIWTSGIGEIFQPQANVQLTWQF